MYSTLILLISHFYTSIIVSSSQSAYARIRAGINLSECRNGLEGKELSSLWKASAPHKSIITAWRILKNRVPTCDNLVRRNVPLTPAETSCARCSSSIESVNHSLLICAKVKEVWDGLLNWIGIQAPSPGMIIDHFRSFTNLGRTKKSKQMLLEIWICAMWTLWK